MITLKLKLSVMNAKLGKKEALSYIYIYICVCVTGPTNTDLLSARKMPIFCLCYHNLITIYTTTTKSITTAEFNGLSSAAYRNGILHSE